MSYPDYGMLEKSASIESGDGWYILHRANLHLGSHGYRFYEGIASDKGDRSAQRQILMCSEMITAEKMANAFS